ARLSAGIVPGRVTPPTRLPRASESNPSAEGAYGTFSSNTATPPPGWAPLLETLLSVPLRHDSPAGARQASAPPADHDLTRPAAARALAGAATPPGCVSPPNGWGPGPGSPATPAPPLPSPYLPARARD